MGLWESVGALVDRTADLDRLEVHRLQLIGARRMRERGLAVPEELVAQERLAAVRELAFPATLARVRDATDGPVLAMKGPVVAARWPDPALRPYWDLDVIVADPWATRRALLDDGWVEVGEPELYRDIHHLRPLAFPQLPVAVELHHRPKWPDGLPGPRPEEILEAAVPGPVDGVLAPCDAHHAVMLAAHGWAHGPLRRVGDLVDVAAVGTSAEAAEVAAAWGCRRLWETTAAAADALAGAGRRPLSMRLWGRHLLAVRRRTVVEGHLTAWLAPGWVASSRRGRAVLGAVLGDLRPDGGEGWSRKLARARRAAPRALMPKEHYDATLPFEEREPVLAAARRDEQGDGDE